MMNDQDLTWLVEQLVGTAELLGQPITPTAAAMLADDLSTYPRSILARALSRVRTEHTGRLTPKAIMDRIDEAMGRPVANEAWATASQAMDERNTIVWTTEMSDAWLVARPIAEAGDMVGARMAFIAAYERLVRAAREARALPEISVSVGWDGATRDSALDKAVQLGYLTPAQAAPHRVQALTAPAFDPVALLTGDVKTAAHADATTRQRLAQLRADLESSAKQDRVAAEQRFIEHQQAVARRKAEIQARVDERIAGSAA